MVQAGTDLYGAPSFAIITTSPNAVIEPIHDRMPVILPPEAVGRWLDLRADDEAQLGGLLPLLAPFLSAEMEAYEVSTTVNSPANDGPECIAPVEHGQSTML